MRVLNLYFMLSRFRSLDVYGLIGLCFNLIYVGSDHTCDAAIAERQFVINYSNNSYSRPQRPPSVTILLFTTVMLTQTWLLMILIDRCNL